MALTVEDGTGLANAESYVSVEDCATYAGNHGLAFSTDDVAAAEAALRRATVYLDATYRSRFPGYRTQGRTQALEWPRVGAYTYVPDDGRSDAYFAAEYGSTGSDAFQYGYSYIQPNDVPREIVAATCEGAIRELAEPGSLAPDLERGGAIQSLRAGSVSIDYANGAPATTTFQTIGLALASLLMPSSGPSARAMRG